MSEGRSPSLWARHWPPQGPHLPPLGTRLLLRLSGANLTPKGIPTAGVAGSV